MAAVARGSNKSPQHDLHLYQRLDVFYRLLQELAMATAVGAVAERISGVPRPGARNLQALASVRNTLQALQIFFQWALEEGDSESPR